MRKRTGTILDNDNLNKFGAIKQLIMFIIIILVLGYGGRWFFFYSSAGDKSRIERFKASVNFSFPVIETVYQGDGDRKSLLNRIISIPETFFGINFSSPISLLNNNFKFLIPYYDNGFLSYLDNRNKNSIEPQKQYITDDMLVKSQEKDDTGTTDNNKSMVKTTPDRINFNKILLDNHTNYKIEIEALLNEPLKIQYDAKKSKLVIYHTHTTEGYLKTLSELNQNVPGRTSNTNFNVVRVGDEITSILEKKYGFDVIHNTTVHDYDYNKSYTMAGNTLSSILKGDPSVALVLDVHRDALGGDQKLRTIPKNPLQGDVPAQIMFVVGTDASGYSHPYWRENLKLAVKFQNRLNEIYPGITKPIILSGSRYNQHLLKGSIIVEMGGDGNTIAEATLSSKYLAQAIEDVLK